MKTGRAWRTVVAPQFPGHAGVVYADQLKSMGAVERAKVLKARMDSFFKQQVGMFALPNAQADFPLVVMSCVGIETLGAYKYGDLGGPTKKTRSTTPDRHFQRLIEDMDAQFVDVATEPSGASRPLSDFVYEGFRHSLVHGFYGKWVHITAETAETDSWFYDQSEKFVVLNVNWFYTRFCEVYEDYFQNLLSCFDPTQDPLKTFHETFQKYFGRWL
jgi:hypothetical protein